MNWYIVQAYSGFEKKVADSIKEECQNLHLKQFTRSFVPTHKVTEVKKGKRTKKRKKIFSRLYSC